MIFGKLFFFFFTLAHLMHYTHMKLYIYNRKGKWEEKSIHFAQRAGEGLGGYFTFSFLFF